MEKCIDKNVSNISCSLRSKLTEDIFYGIFPFPEKVDDVEWFGDKFGVKDFRDVLFYFENNYWWYFEKNYKRYLEHRLDDNLYNYPFFDIWGIENIFHDFEFSYKKFFKEETSGYNPVWIFRSGELYEFEFDPFISPLNFSYISEFSESFLVNREGDCLFLSEYLLSLFNQEINLFVIVEDDNDFENLGEEEIYPDLFFELKNREFLNDQGFYREIYLGAITELFFE